MERSPVTCPVCGRAVLVVPGLSSDCPGCGATFRFSNPMEIPPKDMGSDRYDYVEVQAPPGIRPLGEWWDKMIDEGPCPDCRANLFMRYIGNDPWDPKAWHATIAHDEACPNLAAMEK